MLSPQSSSQNDEDNVGTGVVPLEHRAESSEAPQAEGTWPSPFLHGTNIQFD